MDRQKIENTYRIIREIDRHYPVTQRDLSRNLGYSLGKVNYLVKALVDKGMIKLENFKNSRNKLAYRYILTPRGMQEKARITREFLRIKELEYDKVRREIEELREELL